MSVLSDHRSSPTFNRRENQGLSSAGITRPNRVSATENITDVANDVTDQTGTHSFTLKSYKKIINFTIGIICEIVDIRMLSTVIKVSGIRSFI